MNNDANPTKRPQGPSLSSSAERTRAIVDGLLGNAARRGELGVNVARLIGSGCVSVLWPAVHWQNLVELVPRAVAVLVLAWIALAWSLFVRWRLRRENPSQGLLYTSITVDALLVNSLVLMYLLAPGRSHDSIVEVHGTAFVYLAIVMAGVRLSKPAAVYGAVINSAMLVGLVAASTVAVDNLTLIGPPEWITVGVGLIASAVLGVTVAARTTRLVEQAARETLLSESARAKLGAYISPQVADIVLRESELRLGGERQEVAVLFSDLRGFTSYSESLEPEEIVDQLNDYMRAMVDTIARHGGIVDKFMGDGIMAVFGAPEPREDDADRAIECARAMMGAIDQHNAAREANGLPRMRHGIGVHYGTVVAGNVGTAERAAYTVIGDTVNLASRLESATKQAGVDIAVSEETAAACVRPHGLRRIDEVRVPGRERAVTIFSV